MARAPLHAPSSYISELLRRVGSFHGFSSRARPNGGATIGGATRDRMAGFFFIQRLEDDFYC